MKTTKQILLILVLLLMALMLSSCVRGRFRQTVTDNPGNAAVPTIVVQNNEATSTGNAAMPADLSSDMQDLDQVMDELDQLLGSTSTDVTVP